MNFTNSSQTFGILEEREKKKDQSRSNWPHRFLVQIDVLVHAKVFNYRYAAQILAPLAVKGRHSVKQYQLPGKHQRSQPKAYPDEYVLPAALVRPEGNEREEGVGEKEPEEETDHVGVVVDPRKQPQGEEPKGDWRELAQSKPRVFEHGPGVEDFDEEAG